MFSTSAQNMLQRVVHFLTVNIQNSDSQHFQVCHGKVHFHPIVDHIDMIVKMYEAAKNQMN